MPSDSVRRQAARTATLVAVPVAVVVAIVSLWTFSAFDARDGETTPTPRATSAVSMPAPTLAAETAAVCRTVIAGLPDTVREARRRPVSSGSEQNAAYGDPPITIACGVTQPSFSPTDRVFPLSGVCWYPVVGPSATEWTTVDRVVVVTVTVPGPMEGSAQSVIPFSAAIGPADPPVTTPPVGCT